MCWCLASTWRSSAHRGNGTWLPTFRGELTQLLSAVGFFVCLLSFLLCCCEVWHCKLVLSHHSERSSVLSLRDTFCLVLQKMESGPLEEAVPSASEHSRLWPAARLGCSKEGVWRPFHGQPGFQLPCMSKQGQRSHERSTILIPLDIAAWNS
jgi:hypothetical protein